MSRGVSLLLVTLVAGCDVNTEPPPLRDVEVEVDDTGATLTTTTISDPAELDGIEHVRGHLVIAAAGPIRLPDLVVIDGDLRVVGSEARPTRADLNLPKLARIGGNLEIGWTTDRAKLLAPRLSEIGGHLNIFEGDWAVSLPSLEKVNGDVRFTHGTLESLELDGLKELGGSFRAIAVSAARAVSYKLDGLEGVGVDFVVQGGSALIDAPRCLSIGGSLVIDGTTASVSFEGLREVLGDVRVEDSIINGFDLGGILDIGDDLVFDHVAGTSFESVELYALVSVSGGIRVVSVEGVKSVGFPSLLEIGGSFVVSDAPSLTAIVATLVETLGGSLIVTDVGNVQVTLSLLTTVGGDVISSGNLAWQGNLFNILDIGGDLRMTHQDFVLLGMSSLVNVSGSILMDDLTGGSQFDELRFDSLRTVGRSFQISNTRKLERFAVDALLSVQDGDFVVRDNANSGGITFPALGAVAGSIIIRDNPKMPTDSLMNELSDVESSGPPLVCGNLGGDPCP